MMVTMSLDDFTGTFRMVPLLIWASAERPFNLPLVASTVISIPSTVEAIALTLFSTWILWIPSGKLALKFHSAVTSCALAMKAKTIIRHRSPNLSRFLFICYILLGLLKILFISCELVC